MNRSTCLTIAAAALALACGGSEPGSTTTAGGTSTPPPAAATQTTATESPLEQIREGTSQMAEGAVQAGRGVAAATGSALEQVGKEVQERIDDQPATGTPPAAPAPSSPGTATELPPLPGSVARADGDPAGGKSLFTAKCASCHGANGGADTTMAKNQGIQPLASPAVQQLSDAELARIITEGKSPRSAGAHKSRNLTPDQVRNVIAWIRTLA